MHFSRAVPRVRLSVIGLSLTLFFFAGVASAAIDALQLGARYDGTQANITFKVYSSRATRIEVWIYKDATGFQEKVKYVMVKDAVTNVWSKTASVATLQTTYGITGTVYYGYRAWGPNWPYNASWVKGSGLGFISDVDAQGNRFNPNKLLLDPYAREVSHDPQTATQTDGTRYASGST
ncbi:MAG: isoamylase, partial [Acidobacteriota bacterium]|nr:isoamylase [Acidobacteriota bacterium]